MPGNFSFVIDGQLAGSALPGGRDTLENDLRFFREHGITAIVSVINAPLEPSVIAASGMRYLHLDVPDFTPPSTKQLKRAVVFIDDVIAQGGAVVVHCMMGIGRTGTVLGAYLVSKGATPEQAVTTVRARRPGSIETMSQYKAIERFAEYCSSHEHDELITK